MNCSVVLHIFGRGIRNSRSKHVQVLQSSHISVPRNGNFIKRRGAAISIPGAFSDGVTRSYYVLFPDGVLAHASVQPLFQAALKL